MFEEKVLQSVAMQLMNGEQVVVEDQKLRVKRVGRGRLRQVQFELNGRKFEAIEQNRMKPSRWGETGARKASGGAVSRCADPQVCGSRSRWSGY